MPSWEDTINSQGGEFQVNLNLQDKNLAFVNEIWEALVLDIVSKRMPFTNEIAGVRIGDKSRGGNELTIRLDIWTKFKDENTEAGRDIRDFIAKEYLEKYYVGTKVTWRGHSH